jgi:hypothetical protein
MLSSRLEREQNHLNLIVPEGRTFLQHDVCGRLHAGAVTAHREEKRPPEIFERPRSGLKN